MQSNGCPLKFKESAKKVLCETMLAFIQKYNPGHVANFCDYAQAYRTYVLVIGGANRHECRHRSVLAQLVEMRFLLLGRKVKATIYF